MENTASIFVFTDNLTVHDSFSEAAAYHEYREPLQAFDEHGQAFEIPTLPGAEPIPQPGDQRKAFVRRLRLEVVGFAITHPDLVKLTKWEVKHAPDDEIIAMAVRWFSAPAPSGGLSVLGCVVTLVISPVLAVAFVVFYILLLCGLVYEGAKRAWGGKKRPG